MAERLILVVDDEEPQRRVLAGFLRKAGYEVEAASSADEALAVVAARMVDLVLTDLRMPGKTGVELLDAVRGVNPEVPVVVMTAYGTVASAVDAMKRGAADYLGKPVDLDELEVLVVRTLERRALVSENRALREQVESRYRLAGLETANARDAGGDQHGRPRRGEPGHHPDPRRERDRARSSSPGRSTTRARAGAAPLVAVNVAALPETLLESELFGHERGAFTGADREHRGRFELADGGTLFLDEIGDLPRGTQVKLLRVLQEQSFERLGGTKPIKVDVRLVAATHRDLEAMARAGDFREDLFFRLNVVAITLPPLRERKEDIPLLVDHFLRRFADEGKARSVSREAMDLLLKHDYPGNVRELENLVHRAVVLSRGDVITTADLPLHLAGLKPEVKGEEASFTERVLAFEKALIYDALEKAGGVQTRAAAALGMSERHLRYKLKKYGAP